MRPVLHLQPANDERVTSPIRTTKRFPSQVCKIEMKLAVGTRGLVLGGREVHGGVLGAAFQFVRSEDRVATLAGQTNQTGSRSVICKCAMN